MKAVILSAGQGKRLLPLTEQLPKCLLPLGVDTTVLSWQLSQLAAAGIDEAVVVTGFQTEKVEKELQHQRHLPARPLYNPFYGVADNLSSVWLACRETGDEDLLLLNGDTLFTAEVVERLLAGPAAPITMTVSRKGHYDADDMKVRLDGKRLTDVGKTLDPDSVDAESIGMMLFRGQGTATFRQAVDSAMRGEDALRVWYLSVLNRLAKETTVMTAEAGPDEWCEIDFPVDLRRAREAAARWSPGSAGLDAAAS